MQVCYACNKARKLFETNYFYCKSLFLEYLIFKLLFSENDHEISITWFSVSVIKKRTLNIFYYLRYHQYR